MPGNTRVREVMTKQVVTIGPDAPVNEAADILAERRVDALPVVDAQGRLLGMLRDDDLISTEARVHVPGFINFLGLAMPWPGEMRELEDEIKKIASSNVRDLMDTDVHPVSRPTQRSRTSRPSCTSGR